MADDIIQFSPGEKVTAEETNENNLLLKEWALDNSASETYIDSKIATLTSNLNGQISSINTQISNINGQVSSLNNSKISATTSKNTSGYIKFSNGIIIQWMQFTQNADSANHTWQTNFTSGSSYTTVITQTAQGEDWNIAVKAQAASYFTCYATSAERRSKLYAIAVGY